MQTKRKLAALLAEWCGAVHTKNEKGIGVRTRWKTPHTSQGHAFQYVASIESASFQGYTQSIAAQCATNFNGDGGEHSPTEKRHVKAATEVVKTTKELVSFHKKCNHRGQRVCKYSAGGESEGETYALFKVKKRRSQGPAPHAHKKQVIRIRWVS